MDFKKIITFYSWSEIPPEFISSFIAMLVVIIFAIIIHIKLKKYDPLKRPSGFLNAFEAIVEFCDKQVASVMGPSFEGFGGYILALGAYILIGFIIGMIGLPNVIQPGSSSFLEALPNPFTNLAMPLSLAICTFCLTHFTAIKCQKWTYFRRYIEPFPVFLPINLVTMWSSVLSLTLRLFGNALAGYCIITLIYVGIGTILPPDGSYFGLILTPFLAPIAHLYFDIFDGLIQLAVFTILTMINVSNEYISKEDYEKMIKEEKELKELKLKRKLEKKALKESVNKD